MDMGQYLDVFVEETREHLASLNANLLALERNPADVDTVRDILRSAHTLKGMAATMGFERMARLTHALEDGLELVKSGQQQITGALLDVLFACLDRLEAQLTAIVESGSDADVTIEDILEQLKTALAGGLEPETDGDAPSAKASAVGTDHVAREYQIRVRFEPNCLMPAVRAYMVLETYSRLGEVTACTPSLEELRAGQFGEELSLVLVTTARPDEIRQQGLSVSEVAALSITAVGADAQPLAKTGKGAHPGDESGTTVDTPGDTKRSRRKLSRTIRVDIERLDALMNLMSEFVIDRTRLEELSRTRKDPELNETVRHLSRVGSELQDMVMKIRMVPVDTVFNRFPRMVRDLAKALGKQVDLKIEGAQTELDRTVADEIGDPLVHILRNALDHGLESPAERVAAGKPATGTITLAAYQAGNRVYIEIHDDGRGIDCQKVVQKAIERDLIDPAEAGGLTEAQVFEFLFYPGFSTAETVSNISGRGVGLDAVRAKIQSLGGDVTVRSSMGRGTTFIIELPLTLSILPAMMVSVAEERYAIPLNSIVQMQRVSRQEVSRAHGQETIQYRGSVLPLIDLGVLFWNRSVMDKPVVNVVILRKGEKMSAIAVDDFLGQQDIVLKSLGAFFAHPVAGVAGATITGDGRIALVLDPNAVMR